MSKKLINLSNLQKFLLKLNERFALKKAMKGITEDSEGNIIIGEEGLVPTPDENSKGKFLRSDGTWSVPGDSPLYESMSQEEGVAGVSEVDRVINAKTLKAVIEENKNVVHTSGNETIDGTKTFSSKIVGNLQGNADTATQFSANKAVTLKGDVTGTASSKGGWSVSTTLANSGVTAGSYGPTANVTGNNNSTVSIPQITVDAKGRVTSVVNRTLTCKNNTYTIPTKVSQLTNDSKFVNTTQLATKANDADVVHKSGNEDINGTKSFKTMPKIAGTYFGNEASINESTCLYLTSKRDTIDKSGAYLVRFRQNKEQGALEGVSYISQDILENGTRHPRVLVSGLAFGSDFTPSYYYLSSQSSMPSYLGIETHRWDYVYGVDANFSNSVTTKTGVVQENLVVSGNATLKNRIYFDNTNNTSLICKSVQVDKGEIPTVEQTFDVMLGDKSGGVGWVDRLAHLRLTCIPDTGDTMASIVAFSTLSTTDKGNASISVKYEKATNKFITAAPTPPANDNSTQIATTAWVTNKLPQLVMCIGASINIANGTIRGSSCYPVYQTEGGFQYNPNITLVDGTYKILSSYYPGYVSGSGTTAKHYFLVTRIA